MSIFPEVQPARWNLASETFMESVLLGMAAPAAVSTAGNLLDHTLHATGEPFAALLRAIASVASPESGKPTAATNEDINGQLKAITDALANDIESTLKNAGVDLSRPVTLQISNTDGHLEVVGDHPQKAIIEAALADNPELADMFAQVAALSQLLNATDSLNGTDLAEAIALGKADQQSGIAIFAATDDGPTLEFKKAEDQQ